MTIDEVVAETVASRSADWQQALNTVNHWVASRCRAALGPGSDPMRLHCEPGRIKEPSRIIDKLRRKGRDHVTTADEVEACITDVVATKVLCKSTRDQKLLDEALRTVEAATITRRERINYVLMDPEDEEAPGPKETGYRAVHYLFEVAVEGSRPVIVELQIKTRLQDAWGELTHEDLYKPGSALKPSALHASVARAMANLLAQVDALADDLADDVSSTLGACSDEGSPRPRPDLVSPDGVSDMSGKPIQVTVRTTGPRYALAVDQEGLEGIVLARDVRELAEESGLINVDDYIHVGDVLRVVPSRGEQGQFFRLQALPEHD